MAMQHERPASDQQRLQAVGRQAERGERAMRHASGVRLPRDRARGAQGQRQRDHGDDAKRAGRPDRSCASRGRGSSARRSAATRRRRCSCRRRRCATAMPRRFSNQCEMSAINGAKVAAALKPISAWAAANRPSTRWSRARGRSLRRGRARSRSRRRRCHAGRPAGPTSTPPTEEADHVHGIGEGDVGAADAEIALHGGQRDGEAHMPMPPSVLSVTLAPRRRQA